MSLRTAHIRGHLLAVVQDFFSPSMNQNVLMMRIVGSP